MNKKCPQEEIKGNRVLASYISGEGGGRGWWRRVMRSVEEDDCRIDQTPIMEHLVSTCNIALVHSKLV